MAFSTTVHLAHCNYSYQLQSGVKKYTLRDNTFEQTKNGTYQLSRILEEVPNSNKGFLLKIIINPDITGFKINITDMSGLRLIDIFKPDGNQVIQEKFYFLMDSLVDRGIFTKENHS